MEDEFAWNYICRILDIVVGTKIHVESKEEDEFFWKILKNLTPPLKKVGQMIQLLIQIFFGILEETKVDLRQSRDLTRVEIEFSALNVCPCLSRKKRIHVDYFLAIVEPDLLRTRRLKKV